MIWCVEDDPSIRDIEVYSLISTGFEANGFSSGREMYEALRQEKPELILLDIMLPGEDGVAILTRLKTHPDTGSIPVIMATAKGSEFDKIQSLDLGADDFLVKPFGMMEMVSRVKAVLRRCGSSANTNVLQLQGLVMNLDERTVTVDGQRIALTFKEYEVLRMFLSKPGVAYTRDQLYTEAWGADRIVESRTVDMHIRTLRQKLGNYGQYIETVRNIGYRMEAEQ